MASVASTCLAVLTSNEECYFCTVQLILGQNLKNGIVLLMLLLMRPDYSD